MRKLFALVTSALLILTVTACSSDNEEADGAAGENGSTLARQGEYLTDYIQTLSVNGKEFSFPATFDEMKEIFGDDMKSRYPDYPGSVLDKKDGTYWVVGEFVFDGYYWGRINFTTENENGENAVIDWFNPDFHGRLGEDQNVRDVTHLKDGETVTEQFIYEDGKIPYSMNGFATGTATRAEISGYFEGVSRSDLLNGVTTDNYVFEDYVLTIYYGEYGEADLLTRFMITTNYGGEM